MVYHACNDILHKSLPSKSVAIPLWAKQYPEATKLTLASLPWVYLLPFFNGVKATYWTVEDYFFLFCFIED